MDKEHFDQLVKGVREMKRHMAGKTVRGAKSTEVPAPDVRTIREAAHHIFLGSPVGIGVARLPSCPVRPGPGFAGGPAPSLSWLILRCSHRLHSTDGAGVAHHDGNEEVALRGAVHRRKVPALGTTGCLKLRPRTSASLSKAIPMPIAPIADIPLHRFLCVNGE